MSFWNLSDGTSLENNDNFEIEGAGGFEPIPNGTQCLAAIEEIKWDEYEGDRFINVKWRIMQPSEYEKRVIFHKIKVYGTSMDKNPERTADNAKRMLGAIDTIAGGKLQTVQGEPSDMQLMSALAGKMVIITLMIWEFNDKSGNWVSAVASPKNNKKTAAPKQDATSAFKAAFNSDEDVPF